MTTPECPRDAEIFAALSSGRWPDACDSELREHAGACPSCRELALVATCVAGNRRESEAEVSVPAPGAVWWRMQVRMEREAKEAAARTVRGVHTAMVLAISGAIVAILALTSLLRAGWSWLVSALPHASELASLAAAPSPVIVIVAALSVAVITPVALYLAVAEE